MLQLREKEKQKKNILLANLYNICNEIRGIFNAVRFIKSSAIIIRWLVSLAGWQKLGQRIRWNSLLFNVDLVNRFGINMFHWNLAKRYLVFAGNSSIPSGFPRAYISLSFFLSFSERSIRWKMTRSLRLVFLIIGISRKNSLISFRARLESI